MQKTGALIISLSTNAPAYAAGLRKGDLLLELNHQPLTTLRNFRQSIEQSRPGSMLSVKSWRDGKFQEHQICLGTEKYRRMGYIAFGLMPRSFNFGSSPGLSLGVLGYQLNAGDHPELAAVDHQFARKYSRGAYEPTQQDWAVWLALFEVSKGKAILSQDPCPSGSTL
jgi:hypothetical protein